MINTGIEFVKCSDVHAEHCVLIQTNNKNKAVSELCISSASNYFLENGYDLAVVDYLKFKSDNFFQIALNIVSKYEYRSVVLCFDDLYFDYIDIVNAKLLSQVFDESGADMIKLDPRPSGFIGQKRCEIDGHSFYDVKQSRYMYSTVLSSMTKKALNQILISGIITPWDLENSRYPILDAIVVDGRRAKYRNLIIKGKLDAIALLFLPKFRISILQSAIRLIRRNFLINKIIEKIAQKR